MIPYLPIFYNHCYYIPFIKPPARIELIKSIFFIYHCGPRAAI